MAPLRAGAFSLARPLLGIFVLVMGAGDVAGLDLSATRRKDWVKVSEGSPLSISLSLSVSSSLSVLLTLKTHTQTRTQLSTG